MFNSLCDKKGITIIEVVITLFLTTVGIMALLSMQPISWQAAGRADFMGRAAGILQSELGKSEIRNMSGNFESPSAEPICYTVTPSGKMPALRGDIVYKVEKKISDLDANSRRVDVRVTWPGNDRGIAESLTVTRQETFN